MGEEKIEQRKVTLPGLDASLPVEIVTEDGIGLIKHDVLENFIKKLTRIKSVYHAVCVNSNTAVVECTMTDSETGYQVTKVGETNASNLKGTISNSFPVTMAYQRAYNRAAIAILGLSESGKTYSDVEVSKWELQKNSKEKTSTTETPPSQEKPKSKTVESGGQNADVSGTAPEYTMTDDTILLIGTSSGLKYGDVKNTKKFQSYVAWCKKQTDVAFQSEEQKQQFVFLKNLA